jgi:hypothetical protein
MQVELQRLLGGEGEAGARPATNGTAHKLLAALKTVMRRAQLRNTRCCSANVVCKHVTLLAPLARSGPCAWHLA